MLRKLYDAVIAQAELISRGTLRVDETTELNDDTDVDGDLDVTGDQSVGGSASVDQNQNVGGDQTVSGDQTVQGTATVEGSPEQDQDVTRKTELDSVEAGLSDDIDAVDADLDAHITDFESHQDRHHKGGDDELEIVDLDASGGEEGEVARVTEDGGLEYAGGGGGDIDTIHVEDYDELPDAESMNNPTIAYIEKADDYVGVTKD